MSKSIYEEALLELECLDIDMHNVMEDYVENYDYDLIHKALEQAQRQEKLLELYKKQNAMYKKLMTMELSRLALDHKYYEIELYKIELQIKELESEKEKEK